MIELTTNPEVLLTAEPGDRVTYKGRELVVKVSGSFDGAIYLTTADSRVEEHQRLVEFENRYPGHTEKPVMYADYIKHLRIGQAAVNSRTRFVEAINDGLTYIG